jgi:hypothetical protein
MQGVAFATLQMQQPKIEPGVAAGHYVEFTMSSIAEAGEPK